MRVRVCLTALFIGAFVLTGAPPALAASRYGCQYAYMPAATPNSQLATVVTGQTMVSCAFDIAAYQRQEMCLERSSWTGYRTWGCTGFSSVQPGIPNYVAGQGCKAGVYDWHTHSDFEWGLGFVHVSLLDSEALPDVYCTGDVPFIEVDPSSPY